MQVGILTKPESKQAVALGKKIIKWLKKHNISASAPPEIARLLGMKISSDGSKDFAEKLDLVIVLGGDGTLLHAASLLGERQVPVMGVNLGGLGFLTEIKVEEVFDALELFLQNKLLIKERMTLTASMNGQDESYSALNEFAITVGDLPRLIDLKTHVDGVYVTSFRSDGLIISTPTGSTAYCMSAGGPIVYPGMDCIILTPIAPHTLTSRPLVVSSKSEVCVTLNNREKEGMLMVDGRKTRSLSPGDKIKIRKAEAGPLLALSPSMDYYEILRTKLHWGEL